MGEFRTKKNNKLPVENGGTREVGAVKAAVGLHRHNGI